MCAVGRKFVEISAKRPTTSKTGTGNVKSSVKLFSSLKNYVIQILLVIRFIVYLWLNVYRYGISIVSHIGYWIMVCLWLGIRLFDVTSGIS